jgi:DNA-binding response OmpR family regulator
LLRIETVLKRYNTTEPNEPEIKTGEVYRCEIGRIDVGKRHIQTATGKPLPLTDTEFDLLIIFLRNPSRIMSRDDLYRLLKGRQWDPSDRNLDGHVARLRKKIEPDPVDPKYIKTVRNIGYVFTGEVTQIAP